MLAEIVQAINHPVHPASKLQSLSIVNLQDEVGKELNTSDDFKAVVSQIDTLELTIASWHETENTQEPSTELESSDMHLFWGRHLQNYWLIPVLTQLVRLKLDCRWTHWDYIPKCNLKGLHFPKLQELVLSKMTFTHDWQLNWIISHGKTLKSLTLNDCPILHASWVGHPLDDRHYPVFRLGRSPDWIHFGDAEDLTYWTYKGRWHTHFEKLQRGLPFLRELNLSLGWLCSSLDPPKLAKSRCCIFYFAAWCGMNHILKPPFEYGVLDMECMESKPWYPSSAKRDQKGLNKLVKVIRKGNQGKA